MQTGRLVAQYLQCDVLMYCDVLELVRAGDTRWTSNYRAVRAVRHCLRTIVITLQEIHSAAGDLSSEAGGLLLTFQNRKSVLLIFALEQVLQPLNALTLGLQSPKLSLAELPQKVDSAISRLQEIIADSIVRIQTVLQNSRLNVSGHGSVKLSTLAESIKKL